jgi:hypothetical protein
VSCWSKVVPTGVAWANASTPPLAVFHGPATSVVGLAIVGFMVVGLTGEDQDLYWNALAAGPDTWERLDNSTAALCPTLTSAVVDIAVVDVAIIDSNPEG